MPSPPPPHQPPRALALTLEDRDAIRELRARFSDAANLRQFDAFAALFARDGVWEVPDMHAAIRGRDAIRAGVETMLGQWSLFVRMTHDGPVDALARLGAARANASGSP